MKLSIMSSYLKNDFALIEKELESAIYSDLELLQEASFQLLKAGGKRIRPIFVLLSSKFGQSNFEEIKQVAVTLELIHMASLVHDDVIDRASTRRGQPTINNRYSDEVAMYTGDFILANSLEYITKVKNPLVHQVLADTIIELCIGEIVQIKDKYHFEQSLRDYLRRIKRKTALLIAVSCQIGAIAGQTDEKTYNKLYQFGYNIGMSYQIIDDILDFTATEKQLGKPAGEDLRQGNITLPALIAMKDPKIKAEIVKVHEHIDQAELTKIIDMIKASGAIDQSFDISNRYLDKARNILNEFPNIRARKTLLDITNYIQKRTY